MAAAVTHAGDEAFTNGPVIESFGPVTEVRTTMNIPADTVFRHSVDVSGPAPDGQPNRTLVSAARFMNMHARTGVPSGNVRLAPRDRPGIDVGAATSGSRATAGRSR